MRSAASTSWTLRFDVLEEPHVALFVRDALDLDRGVARQPPRLEDPVPDLRGLVSDEERERLEQFYRPYWQRDRPLPGCEPQIVAGAEQDAVACHRQMERWLEHFYQPLAAHRELRDEASLWFKEHRERHEPMQRDHDRVMARWKISREAAEAAAADLGVDPGQLSVDTWLVMVKGVWWAAPHPGQLLYSPAVREDRNLLSELLYDTFTASLNS